jgi:hypothetical protein
MLEARRRGPRPRIVVVLLAICLAGVSTAEEPTAGAPEVKKPSLVRDPEDGAIDLSGWLATRTGVLPIPVPITEPAVGYGAALALVNFRGGGLAGASKAPGASGKPVPPDIAAVGGGLTENGTWAVFAAYIGHFKEDRWRYKGAVSRLAPTLDYYGSNEQAYSFTMDGWAVYQEVGRRLGKSDLFAGVQLAYVDTTVSFEMSQLPPEIPRPEFGMTESGLGPFVEWDTRNNSLTPSSGFNLKASAMFLGPWLGGDNAFERYTGTARFYWDPKPRFVLAARLQAQGVSGDAPFYALPFVYLRGIPVMRYQGDTALSVDGEVRWNAWKRWWVVAFAGQGWTADAPGLSKEGESVHAGGLGFRYLIARRLGLQAGLDVAKGPEEYAIYVVAGSSF